jgi:hypothetical protein
MPANRLYHTFMRHICELRPNQRITQMRNFVRLLVEQYPTGRVVLVMDNVSYHKSTAVLTALSLFEHRVPVSWLPPYCPELNLIERYWKRLKALACVNRLYNSMDEVVTSAEFVLSQQNEPNSILRLTFSKVL